MFVNYGKKIQREVVIKIEVNYQIIDLFFIVVKIPDH